MQDEERSARRSECISIHDRLRAANVSDVLRNLSKRENVGSERIRSRNLEVSTDKRKRRLMPSFRLKTKSLKKWLCFFAKMRKVWYNRSKEARG